MKFDLADYSWQWDPEEPSVPLMLYESQARQHGVSESDIEKAKTTELPCPFEWGVPQLTWTVITPIPMHIGTFEGVRFIETKRGRK